MFGHYRVANVDEWHEFEDGFGFEVVPDSCRLDPVIEIETINVDCGSDGLWPVEFNSQKRLGPLAGPRRPQVETCGGISVIMAPVPGFAIPECPDCDAKW